MKPESLHGPIDVLDIEARARKLRAEAMVRGFGRFGRWVAAPFYRRRAVRA